MTDAPLDAMEPWLEGILARLKPGARLRLARKIGQMLRRRNAARIRKNVEPDGTKMEPRARMRDRKGRLRGRHGSGRMFKKIGLARNMKIKARPDSVEVSFAPKVARTAAVHHFGLRDRVENRRNSVRVRYPERRLLGIPKGDREVIMEESMKALKR